MPGWLKHPIWLFLAIAAVYFLAIPVDIMEVDSAQYFSIAREMMDRGDYLHVYDRGVEYLDKPPFIFWITSLFFAIFGVNEFAFKLPSILFSLLGIYATYRFTLLYYSKKTALFAALILATTQGYFHFNNDIRTDTYLTNSIITAVWLLAEHLRSPRWFWWIAGFIFIGVAMLAKGPIGLMVPVLAFGTHILLKKQWSLIFRWEWLAGIVIILLVLLPMMIGLYEQFDLHPEKLVNDRHGVSGLRFFFWEQSFGRITGENVWKNDTGPFYFVHNLAWSFLPWTLLFFVAFGQLVLDFVKAPMIAIRNRPEWISAGGFILPFIALSASSYKLPHYIYVTFPFAAVISAAFFSKITLPESRFNLKWLNVSQSIVLLLCWVFGWIIFTWFFPLKNPLLIITAFAGTGLFGYYSLRKFPSRADKIIGMSVSSALAFNILLAAHFYPAVLEYQASGQLGKRVVEKRLPVNKFYHFIASGRAFDVYSKSIPAMINIADIDSLLIANQGVIYVHTNRDGLNLLEQANLKYKVVLTAKHFPPTRLSINFANPSTRESVLEERFILEVEKK